MDRAVSLASCGVTDQMVPKPQDGNAAADVI